MFQSPTLEVVLKFLPDVIWQYPVLCGTLRLSFLKAGAKSSPVLISSILDTNNEKTVYLYNLNRDAIIEYQRQIVEPKIHELKSDEGDLIGELVSGYKAAKKNFAARNKKPIIDTPVPKQGKAVQKPLDEDPLDADDVVDVDNESFLFDDG